MKPVFEALVSAAIIPNQVLEADMLGLSSFDNRRLYLISLSFFYWVNNFRPNT